MNEAIVSLFFFSIVFLILGIYLHEIVKKEYGVTKDWLFCLKRKKKKI
jgi:hypothetical protein